MAEVIGCSSGSCPYGQKLTKKYLLVRHLYKRTRACTPEFWHYSDLLNKYSKLLDEA